MSEDSEAVFYSAITITVIALKGRVTEAERCVPCAAQLPEVLFCVH